MHAFVNHRGALLPSSATNDTDANGRLAAWVKGNCIDLEKRLTIMPQKRTPTDGSPYLSRFASGGTVEITRGRPHSPGGPVLVAWPTLDGLAHAVRATPRDQLLICLESTPSCAGWASAVGAYNAATDAVEPPLEDELVEDFKYLLMWDSEILEGAKRGRGRERIHPTIRKFKDAGLDEQFVATYAIGLGASGTVAEHLKLHYREV